MLGPVGPSGRRFGPSPWWAAAFALALRASPRRLAASPLRSLGVTPVGSGCRRLASPVARLRAPPPRPVPWPACGRAAPGAGPRWGVGLGLLRASLAGRPARLCGLPRPLPGPRGAPLRSGPLRGLGPPGRPGSSRRAGLAALRHIVYGDPKRLYAFRLPPEELRWVGHAAEAYVAAQLERGFRTLDFYKQIKTD